ncbi:cadmium-translocating P-type ATPase [Verrucomicrobia bacterium LW23]|nr:cadmium-translocating P-type ATPase [Verrucomicrobia bacterium LW23]
MEPSKNCDSCKCDDNHQHDAKDGHDHNHDDVPSSIKLNDDVKASRETTLKVAGMDCADEVAALQNELRPIKGIKEIKVNLMGGKVTVNHDDSVDEAGLIKAISKAGLTASPANKTGGDDDADLERSRYYRQMAVWISGALTGIGLVLQWTSVAPAWVADSAFFAAIIAGGWFIVPKAIGALRRFSLDMNVLMTVAVIGAVIIQEYSEGAAVAFLFSLSELLEAFSLARARKAIQSLMKLAPETAMVKDGDSTREVPVAEVEVGTIFYVKSGSRVPLDGVVTSGNSSINQAPITGESMPVEKKEGDSVFGGTINGTGSLEVKATKAYSDTTLSKIIHLVEEAQSQKAPSQQFVDVFARYYTPSVMVLAILVAILPPLLLHWEWMTWIYKGLVLLVIACPCALVISTPVSVVSGLTAMARRGVLIKGGVVLEAVGRLNALAVDKTGTITEGKPRVVKVVSEAESDEKRIVSIAASIDSHSEHPLAQAVIAYAKEKGINFPRSTNYQARTGRGAEADIDGQPYFVGNHRLAHDLKVCSPELERKLAEIEAEAYSVVVVGRKPNQEDKGEVLGVLAVGDEIRSNAAESVKALHAAGIKQIVMLSGDNQRTADAIAKKAGIDKAMGDLLPDQKIEWVKAMIKEGKHVGMIGDGVNDAPAMAAATVGIAMGTGTDTALETADMALMKDDLSKVADAVVLGRKTLGIIQFNIVFSLVIKAVFLILALIGYTSLWLAIAADTGATLLVIANALRLLQTPEDNS